MDGARAGHGQAHRHDGPRPGGPDLRHSRSSRCRPKREAQAPRPQICHAAGAAGARAGGVGVAAALRRRQPALAAAAHRGPGDAGASCLGRPQVHEAIGVTAAEVVVAFVIAVPLGAAIGVLAAENDYFGADLQADAVLRVQRAEIDLPADVHPDLRHRLPAEGRLRGVLDHLHRHHERDGGGRIGEGRPRAGRALLRRDAHADPAARLRAQHDAGACWRRCASR